jgi:hypothetical protein
VNHKDLALQTLIKIIDDLKASRHATVDRGCSQDEVEMIGIGLLGHVGAVIRSSMPLNVYLRK